MKLSLVKEGAPRPKVTVSWHEGQQFILLEYYKYKAPNKGMKIASRHTIAKNDWPNGDVTAAFDGAVEELRNEGYRDAAAVQRPQTAPIEPETLTAQLPSAYLEWF